MATKPQTTTATITKKTYVYIYPLYINSKKSLSDGRRIAKEHAVENPTALNLFEAIKILGLSCELEPNKTHPRDFAVNGRVKVTILNNDFTPVNSEIPSKDHLLRKIGKAIPQAGSSAQDKKGKKKK